LVCPADDAAFAEEGKTRGQSHDRIRDLSAEIMSLKISRILHAGYVFECNETQIAFDPIFENPFSRNCYAFPEIRFDHEQIKKLKLAAVFISHFHDDHCSLESLNLLDRQTPIYMYCVFEELFTWIRELGFIQVYSLELNVPVIVGTFEIIPRRALDADVDSLFQIKAAGLNVLNVVDSWIDYATLDQLSKQAPWDMILWPFQTMRELEVLTPSRAAPATGELPPEWIQQLKVLNPKYVVASSCQFVQESWSWYNQALFPISYRGFQQQVEAALPQAKAVRLNPGVSVILDKESITPSSSLEWVEPVGDQNVDYAYKPDLKPPATADVAKQFAPLTADQTEKVFEYCRSGLIEKYRSLEPSEEPYFGKPRIWRLSVYDHRGVGTNFYYRLNISKIEISAQEEEPLSWTTEVPISKLYAALDAGESLTSMYVRINDIVFDKNIERDVGSVDAVEDPLIRCLFNGVFGEYQLAQLKRIQALI
jgi:hypothetical protein